MCGRQLRRFGVVFGIVGCISCMSLFRLHSWVMRVSCGAMMGGHINMVLSDCGVLELLGHSFILRWLYWLRTQQLQY